MNRFGLVAVCRNADLVVVGGAPNGHIDQIENVNLVFRVGLVISSARLLDSVRGHFGLY